MLVNKDLDLEAMKSLLERATMFRFAPDIRSRVDPMGAPIDVAALERRYSLYVAEGLPGRWGIKRLDDGARWWNAEISDWAVGFFSLGSRDRTIYLLEPVMHHHQLEAREIVMDKVIEYHQRKSRSRDKRK